MTDIPCCVTQDLNTHLAREEASDARAELVDARCAALMAPGCEYSPTTADAICDALGDARPAFWEKLAAALACLDPRNATGCDLIRKEADNHMCKLALPAAEQQIDDERQAAADQASEDRAESRRECWQDWSAA